MLKSLSATILGIIYPNNCISCKNGIFDEENQFQLCQGCLENICIQKNLPPFCLKCGRHLEEAETEDDICKQCRKTSFYFDRAWSVCIFDGIIKDLIHKFKYSNKTVLAKTFSSLVFDFVMNFDIPLLDYDIMLPVPLHPVRLREREYNQCEILAKQLQKFFPIAISTNDVIRIRNTKPQISLDKSSRWENIKDAFYVRSAKTLKGKNILIIDDLMTTGATASELARTLKDSKVNIVSILTLAIAK